VQKNFSSGADVPSLQEYVAIRRDIHAHPELAFHENRTSDLVAGVLEKLGLEVHRGLASTGVVGKLKRGSSARAIGLRADMDALPIAEKNGFAHRSTTEGCMHACGHDGHTAMLLAAADMLAKAGTFDGTVYFIFQPAEETEGGGRVMVEQGLFERFPMEAVFGMHNWPGLATGQFAVHDGPVMASADRFDITLTGRGAHAAMPHQGTDTILAASALVQALQSVVSRRIDPLEPAVVSITRFQAGDAYNILPEQAHLAGTIRAFSAAARQQAENEVRNIVDGIAATFDLQSRFDIQYGYPATVNSHAEAALCKAVAQSVVGRENVHTDLPPSMGAEDFSFMLQARPGCYVWLGNGSGEGGCMLHNPRYDFNDEVLPIGAAYWCRLAESLLAKP
jgi:amidohydrolase